MNLQLGDTAPNFTADTTEGEIDFHEWLGDGWCMLMSHPADFTPVCTTELGSVGGLKEQFAKRDTKVIVVSVDSVEDHKRWSKDIEETQGHAVNFPIIGDPDHKVAELYGMIHPNAGDTSTVRSVFIIDANKKIRMMLTYPKSAGRNFNEILRVIDSMQLTDNYKVTTPANWEDGDDVIVLPSLSNEEAEKLFPAGWNELKPYLRMTKQPNK
jgi:alkyl hydroperoxide reductase subunit AhpC